MEKHLYVVVARVRNKDGEWKTQAIEVEASGRVDAKFKFPKETGLGDHMIYFLAVYGPYERSNNEQ